MPKEIGVKGPLDGVALLTFARHPISLSETMFWLHAASFPTMNGRPRWANGAAVFVEGLSRGLMAAASVEHLCARHAIVGVEHEHLVHAALYARRPKALGGAPRLTRREMLGNLPRVWTGTVCGTEWGVGELNEARW